VSASTLGTISAAVAAEDVKHALQQHYDLSGELQAITGERDQNYCLTQASGQRFIVKVAHESEALKTLELQSAVISHLHLCAPDVPLSLEVSNHAGATITPIRFANGAFRYLRVNEFMAGVALSEIPRSSITRKAVGQVTARLASTLKDFKADFEQSALLWDIQQAAALLPHVETLPAEKRSVVEAVLQRFLRDVFPLAHLFRSGLIHNDLNLHNLFVDAQDHSRITGVIDFGDMVRAPLINDLAIATSYQLDAARPLKSILDVAEAYHGTFPLQPLEVDHVCTLVAMRFVLTVVITHWRSQLHPENAVYILRNAPAAWAGLLALHDISAAVSREFLYDHLKPKPDF
jgi:hydroxylysine kinase